MNKDVAKLLRQLQGDGFRVETRIGGGGTLNVIAPDGARHQVSMSRHAENAPALRRWAEQHRELAAAGVVLAPPRHAERAERRDRGGVPTQRSRAAQASERRAERVVADWGRLPDDARLRAVREVLALMADAGDTRASRAYAELA